MNTDLRPFAIRGAQARIEELKQEIEEIRRAFPEIEEQTRRQEQIARAAHARAAKRTKRRD